MSLLPFDESAPEVESLDAETEGLIARCSVNIPLFGRTFFPQRFHRPFSKLHYDIFNLIKRPGQKKLIAAPRGFGKTSVMNMLLPAHKIIFNEAKFIVPVSCTASAAVTQSENLKAELVSNVDLTQIFGSQKSEKWSREEWETVNGVKIFPRGAGQQIRGMLHKNSRPDLFIIDDLEDSESVLNAESRKKLWTWFHSDLLGAVDLGSKDWQVIMIGTVLHEDSLLNNLLEDPEWDSIRLSLCNDEYESNWPEFVSNEEVRELAESFKKNGDLDIFYREYRNIPISTEDSIFSSKHFLYYEETSEEFQKSLKDGKIESVILVDPAKTIKMTSDESAIVGCGVDAAANKIYVRDIVAGKFMPDEIYTHTFDMAKRLNALVIGIEVTSLNEFIMFPLQNELMRRGLGYLQIVELKARDKKEQRIKCLAPFYRQGLIFHNSRITMQLEEQLLSFPRARRFDVMDAFAYIIPMMEEGSKYFYQYQNTETYEDIEKEYAKLEDSYSAPLKNWELI